MRNQIVSAVCCAALIVSGSSAFAQRDAGSKARGDIYNFWGAQSSHRHAQDHTQSLYHYGQTQERIPVQQAQEYISSVKKSLETSQRSLAEIKKNNPDNKEALAAIAKVDKIQKKVLAECDHMAKDLVGDDADSTVICDCCVNMHKDLDAANAELEKVRKALKIEKLAVPKATPPADKK